VLKKILITLPIALITVLLINTLRFSSVQQQVEPIPPIGLDQTASVQRLTDILRFKTISHSDPAHVDRAPFIDLRDHLKAAYPRVHEQLSLEVLGGYSLLYRLAGSDPDLKPIALMAHMDVVPIEQATRDQWEHPPFAGIVDDGIVWGRGALDDKSSLVAILEAVEYLLANNMKPRRDIYLAFGHDEELGGHKGMAVIAQELQQRGIHLEYVLDEGGAITSGISSSLSQPTALVAVGEKGGVTLELTMRGKGGHSSQPPPISTIGALSRAIVALEEQQLPTTLDSPTGTMFDVLAREMGFIPRMLFANRWLTEPLLLKIVGGNYSLNPMLRTTTAPTVFSSGLKSNVLPGSATAIINFRLLQGDTIDSVVSHVQTVIDNPNIDVAVKGDISREASPVSDHQSRAFQLIEQSIKQVIPATLVAPNLMTGGSDAKHFAAISDNIYHFVPIIIHKGNITSIHGVNERLPVSEYMNMIRFYVQLLINSSN
jgi:carboxypeptidase PM20D1